MAEIGRESRSLWELSATSPGILRALGLKHLPGRAHPRSHGDSSSMERYSSVRRLLGVMSLVQREKRSLLLIFFFIQGARISFIKHLFHAYCLLGSKFGDGAINRVHY